MLGRSLPRRALLAPTLTRAYPAVPRIVRLMPMATYATQLPSVTSLSFWESMIPKPFRRGAKSATKKPKSTEWNPATFFIVIWLLIGSMAIQMIALRNEFNAFMRRADAKIDLLREVIERVQNGEEVDVEGLLGAGDPTKEKEWEEVLKEIEEEDARWTAIQAKKPRRKPIKLDHIEDAPATQQPTEGSTKVKATSTAPRGFY